MIQGIAYHQLSQDSYYKSDYEQEPIEDNIASINQLSTEIRSSSKKQTHELKFIKQIKYKDIKLSHKKINPFSNKPNSHFKLGSSFEQQKQSYPHQKSPQTGPAVQPQIKQSTKKKKSQNSQKVKQKSNEALASFNPQTVLHSKESVALSREKYNKKLKVSELGSLHQRVRQSRSQNKRQKAINNFNNIHSLQKNNTKMNYENQQQPTNIFQNIDLFAKQNSYHSLDKNHQHQPIIYSHERVTAPMSSKIEEKLHLPSLVGNSGLKNVKSKIQQSINNFANQHNNETEIQKSHNLYPEGGSKTDKSTPYIQKIVKIPIDRLKPLKPQEIKLKYEKKVKQEQKNRAKQRALQIFEKDQEEADRRRKADANKNFEIESDENSQHYQNENRIKQNMMEAGQLKNKSSLIKQEKFMANRGENIFKKKLIAYNGQY